MSDLVTKPHDPYWDSPAIRNEVQDAVNAIYGDLALFRQELGILRVSVKFFLEKLGVSKAELETYVAKKKAELEATQEAQSGSDKQLSTV